MMWKNIVDPGRPQMTVWRMHTACWITKATNTYSDYVILIAFPLHQWLHICSSVFRYMYIVCLVNINSVRMCGVVFFSCLNGWVIFEGQLTWNCVKFLYASGNVAVFILSTWCSSLAVQWEHALVIASVADRLVMVVHNIGHHPAL